jgi:hypothetical protein
MWVLRPNHSSGYVPKWGLARTFSMEIEIFKFQSGKVPISFADPANTDDATARRHFQ